MGCGGEGSPQTHVVDGGYHDDSGASSLVELWPRFQPLVDQANEAGSCLVPFFVQIDADDTTVPAVGRRLGQRVRHAPQRPPGGAWSNAGAARAAAQRMFTGPIDDRGTTATLDGQPIEPARPAPRLRPAGRHRDQQLGPVDRGARGPRDQVAYSADTIEQLRRLLDAPADALQCVPGTIP